MSKEEKELAMRNAHIDTIKRTKNDIEENIDKYGFFDLDEKVIKLQSDWHKLESKNLQIECVQKGEEFDVEPVSSIFFPLGWHWANVVSSNWIERDSIWSTNVKTNEIKEMYGIVSIGIKEYNRRRYIYMM